MPLAVDTGTETMAKPATVKIRLNSTADTGFFYVTKKNPRNTTEKMVFRKYDPVAKKHVAGTTEPNTEAPSERVMWVTSHTTNGQPRARSGKNSANYPVVVPAR